MYKDFRICGFLEIGKGVGMGWDDDLEGGGRRGASF